MMDVLFEQHVVQNTALAAEAIWGAVNEAYESNGRSEGVTLPLVFIVLPLTFHRRTAKVLASKSQPGALYKALGGDREITVGLQQRMEAMSGRTFDALALAFQTRLLYLDENGERDLIPGRRGAIVDHVTDDVRIILGAAKRVGQAIAEMSVVQLSTQLNIRF